MKKNIRLHVEDCLVYQSAQHNVKNKRELENDLAVDLHSKIEKGELDINHPDSMKLMSVYYALAKTSNMNLSLEKFKKIGIEGVLGEITKQERDPLYYTRASHPYPNALYADFPELVKNYNEGLQKNPHDLMQFLLSRYSGLGGLGDRENQTNAILTQYFTPFKTVSDIWRKIQDLGFSLKDINALEPSAGIGNFVGLCPEESVKWDLIEKDEILSAFHEKLYPEENHFNMSFEDIMKSQYDLVITNVPFASSRGAGIIKDLSDIQTLHDYFTIKSIEVAKENGLIVLLLPSSILDNKNQAIKERVANSAEVIQTFRLENNTFKELGANVLTDVVFLRKFVPGEKAEDFENNQLLLQHGFLHDLDYRTFVKSRSILVNKLYTENPKWVLGHPGKEKDRYGKEVMVVGRSYGGYDPSSTEKMIKEKADYIPQDRKEIVSDEPTFTEKDYGLDGSENIEIGESITKGGVVYYVDEVHEGDYVVLSGTKDDEMKIIEVSIRDYLKAKNKEIERFTTTGEVFRMGEKYYLKKKNGRKEITLSEKAIKYYDLVVEISTISKNYRKALAEGYSYSTYKEQLIERINSLLPYRNDFLETLRFMEKDLRFVNTKVLLEEPEALQEKQTIKKYSVELKSDSVRDICNFLKIEYGAIRLSQFASVKKVSEQEAYHLLDESCEVFRLPTLAGKYVYDDLGNPIPTSVPHTEEYYQLREDYLSGNIREKIALAEEELKLSS